MKSNLILLLALIILVGCQASGGGGASNEVVNNHTPSANVFTVTTTLNKTYANTQNIDFNLAFPANVTVTGAPQLTLTIGAASKTANYVSGSGTKNLLFRYTVGATDNDSDGITLASSINLNGGTLVYGATNVACPTSFVSPNLSTVKVDTTSPTLVSVTPPGNGSYFLGQPMMFTANFSEAVLVTGVPRIAIDIGGTTKYATYLSGNNSSNLIFSYLVTNTDSDLDGIGMTSPLDLNGGTIKDAGGNVSSITYSLPNTSSVLVMGANPFVTTVTPPANGTYNSGQNLDFTLTFNKTVNITGSPRLTLTVGATTRYATYLSGTGTANIKFRYTVLGGDADADGVSLAGVIDFNGGSIQDSGAHPAIPNFLVPTLTGVLVASTSPSILSVNIPSSPPATGYDVGQNIDFTVVFSEAMTETGGNSRLKLDVGGATKYATYQSGSGTANLVYRYTVAANDEDLDGLTIISPYELNGSTVVSVAAGIAPTLTFTPPVTTSLKVDAKAPILASNTVPANGAYSTGQNLDFDVTFHEPVLVNGTPRIVLDIGGSTKYADYLSGSGTAVLRFRYVVASGDNDNDGIGTNATIDLNSGSIKDPNTHNAALSLVTTTTTGVLIDTTPATITTITPPANGTYTIGQNLDFTVNWSENVTVTGTPRLAMTVGSVTRYVNYVSGSGTSAHLYRYTVASGDSDSDGVALTSPLDLNGGTLKDTSNLNATLTFTAPNTTGVIITGSNPTISSITLPSNGKYSTGQNVDFTVVFSENVVVSGTPQLPITLTSGSVNANYISGSGTNSLLFRYTVVSNDYDQDGITLVSPLSLNGGTIQNSSLSLNASLTYTVPSTSGILIDGLDPVISSVTPPANKTWILAENMDFVVNYTSAVTVTGTPKLDFVIGSTTVSASYFSGSGTNALTFRYTVLANDLDADGITVTSPLSLNGGTITDPFADNASLTFTAPSTGSVLVDAVAPVISSVAGPSPGLYYQGETLDFDVTFSKSVNIVGSPRIELTVGSSTKYATYLSGSGTSIARFRYTVGAGDTDTDGIAVTATIDLNSGTIKDVPGNALNPLTFTAPNTALVNVDGSAPSIVSITPPADGTYKTGNTMNFTVVFSKPVNVTGSPQLPLTIGAASKAATYLSGSGSVNIVFQYTVGSGDADTDGIAIVSPLNLNGGTIKDPANVNATLTFTAPSTPGVLVDGLDPVISSVTPPANKTWIAGEQMDFIANYSAPVIVTGIPSMSFTIGSTTVAANYLSGSGTNAITFRYTVVTGDFDNDGIVVTSPVALNAGTIKDQFGDNAGLTFTAPVTTGVLVDAIAPVINSVAGPSPGSYYLGENLDFDVTFSKTVAVTGFPRIGFVVGSTTVYASYLSGSGTTIVKFRYTVQAGDLDTDGIVVNSPLDLNGGTIKDLPGNVVSPLTFTAPNTALVNVDGRAPEIVSVNPPANGTYKTTNTLDFSVVFNKPVNVTGTPRIPITIGAATGYANYLSGSGTSTIVFRYTVASGHADTDGIELVSPLDLNSGTIKDSLNVNATLTYTPPATPAILIDGIDIVISSINSPASGWYKTGDNLDFTINYNYPATVTGTPRIAITVGASTKYADYVSGSGTSAHLFRYTVVATDLDTDGIDTQSNVQLNGGTVKDAFGDNANLNFTGSNYAGVKVDTVAPTISSVTGPAPGTYTNGQNIDFTVTFSEIVNLTGSPRIALAIGSTTRYATYTSGSGSASAIFRYTVVSADFDNDGIASASPLQLNSGTMKDQAGNDVTPLTFTTPNTSTVLVDNSASIISVTPPANATYKTTNNVSFVATFDKVVTVTGTPRIAVTVGAATLYANYASGSGTTNLTFTYTVGSGDIDTDGVTLTSPVELNSGTIKDGNGVNASLTFTLPTTTGILIDGIDVAVSGITPPIDKTYKIGDNLDFTVTFNYPATVTGSPRFGVTVGGSTLYANYVSGSGTANHIYRYTVSQGDSAPTGITTQSNLQLNGGTIKDQFGDNATLTFTGTSYPNKKVDGIRPTSGNPTVSANGTYISGQNIDFTFTYSENVTISGSPRLWLTVGSTPRYATYFSGSGTSTIVFRYTIPAGDLDTDGIAVGNLNTIDLNSGSITDIAGNAQTTLTFSPPVLTGVKVDAIVPTITSINPPTSGTYASGALLNFTVNWSENVTITGTPTLTIKVGAMNRTATYVSGSGTTATVFRLTVSLNDSDTDGVDSVSPMVLAGGTIKDSATNNATLTFTGANFSGVLIDAVPPAVSLVTPPANGVYKPTQTLDFTVSYNEVVNVTGSPSVNMTIGSTTRSATYVAGSGTTDLLFRYTLITGDNDYDGLVANTTLQLNGGTIQDAVGNNALTSLGSVVINRVFTVPTELTHWYDLTDTSTVGTSTTTLTQFASKMSSFTGTVTGSPVYNASGFNGQSTGYFTTVSGSKYVTLANMQIKYMIIVFKAGSNGDKVLFDQTGGGNASNKVQLGLQASGSTGMLLGGNCSGCRKYSGGGSWATETGSGVPFTYTTGAAKIAIIDYNGSNNLSMRLGSSYSGDIAEYMVFTGTTAVADSVLDGIATYLNTRHGSSY